MAKTTQATALTLTVDPRVRMKEIRAQVANHLKGKAVSEELGHLKYLSDLPENMDDARRVITALHDLVEKEKEKHNKASDYICEMVHMLASFEAIMGESADAINQQQRVIRDLEIRLADAGKQAQHYYEQSRNDRSERDAVLTTMRLQRNIEAPPPAFISHEEAPQSNRGPVILEQLFQNIAMGRAR